MGFNCAQEKAKFDREWLRLRKEYTDAGMSEAAIQKIYEYDWLMSAGRHKCRHWKLTVQTMNAGLRCFGKTRRFQLLLMKVHFQAVMHGLTHWRMRDYFAPL